MAEHMRYCNNVHCTQYRIPMIFNNGKRCNACNSRTKYLKPGDDLPPGEYVDSQRGLILISSTNKEDEHNDWQDSSRSCKHCSFMSSAHDNDGVCPTANENKVSWFDDGMGKEAPMTPTYYLPSDSQSSHASSSNINSSNKPLTFQSDCDVEHCPVAPAGLLVRVPFSLYHKWVYLAQMLDTEWIAYLTGRLVAATTDQPAYYILDDDGMYFPKQSAGGAHADFDETPTERPNTIAAIHSHVRMKAYFSDTDINHFNHPIEMVINAFGKMDCVTRTQLECGRYQRVTSKVDIVAASPLIQCLEDLRTSLTIVRRTNKDKTIGPSAQSSSKTSERFVDGTSKDEFNKRWNSPEVQQAWRFIQSRLHTNL